MHNARHDTCHAKQCGILLREINAHLIRVPDACKEESCKGSNKERRSEGSATTATTVCGSCGKGLREHDHTDIYDKPMLMAIEQRTVHHLVPISLSTSVKKDIDILVTLTIE